MTEINNSASGDIAIAIQRRKGDIGVPVYIWIDLGSGPVWVDFLTLTGPQFSAWVDARCAANFNYPLSPSPADPPGTQTKVVNLTISRTNDW